MNVSLWIVLGVLFVIGLFFYFAIYRLKDIVRQEVRQEFEFSRTQSGTVK